MRIVVKSRVVATSLDEARKSLGCKWVRPIISGGILVFIGGVVDDDDAIILAQGEPIPEVSVEQGKGSGR